MPLPLGFTGARLDRADQIRTNAEALAAALEQHAAEYARARGIRVEVQLRGVEADRLPAAVETALYRIVQESLTNAAKHNDGTAENPVPMTVRLEGDYLVIENARRARITTEPSTATGLDNLSARCQHAVGRPLRVTETADIFRVDVPIVKRSHTDARQRPRTDA